MEGCSQGWGTSGAKTLEKARALSRALTLTRMLMLVRVYCLWQELKKLVQLHQERFVAFEQVRLARPSTRRSCPRPLSGIRPFVHPDTLRTAASERVRPVPAEAAQQHVDRPKRLAEQRGRPYCGHADR